MKKATESTLKDSAIKLKIDCTEMHDLSKNATLSRVRGLRVRHSWSYNACEYLQVLNVFIYFVNC